MNKNILIVAAHPDDEVLGCGGTIAKLVKDGFEVYALILGEGITSRGKRRNIRNKMNDIHRLREQAKKANNVLGVKNIFFDKFPDNRFDTVALLDIIKAIEHVIAQVKPGIIYTHYRKDLNIDHRITYNAVLTACRPIKGQTVKEIYSFEIPSSTEWNYPCNFNPTLIEDIADTINAKIEAFKYYKTELRNFPHPRSEEVIKIIAKRWGSIARLNYAEVFEVVRIIKATDITLNLVSENDCRNLWLWRNHPDVRKGCFRDGCIVWQEHKQWFYKSLKNKNIRIYVASRGKDKIGVIRFRRLKDYIKVSVNLNPEFFGKGLGANIIRLGTEKVLEEKKFRKPIIAEIRLDNIISQKAFYKAGYKYIKTLPDKVIYKK